MHGSSDKKIIVETKKEAAFAFWGNSGFYFFFNFLLMMRGYCPERNALQGYPCHCHYYSDERELCMIWGLFFSLALSVVVRRHYQHRRQHQSLRLRRD